jgi:DNA invertase Pin-like site-specific DNA recombinase
MRESTMSKQKALAYLRVSTREQGESRNGLDSQRAAVEGFCRQNNIELVYIAEEVISGKYGIQDRPVLKAVLAECKKQKALLVVSKLDRLSRSVQFVSTLMNADTSFCTVEDGLTCSPLHLHIKASIAENERKTIGERTKAALAQVKARGVPLGGVRAGHDGRNEGNKLAIERSKLVMTAEADAFAQRLKPTLEAFRAQRLTVGEIADRFNALEIKTSRGHVGKWHKSSVTNLLKRLYGESYERMRG